VNVPRQTQAMQAGTRFTYPGGIEGWVDLVDLIAPRLRVEPVTFRSRDQYRTTVVHCPCIKRHWPLHFNFSFRFWVASYPRGSCIRVVLRMAELIVYSSVDCWLLYKHAVRVLCNIAGFEITVDHPHTHIVKTTNLVRGYLIVSCFLFVHMLASSQ